MAATKLLNSIIFSYILAAGCVCSPQGWRRGGGVRLLLSGKAGRMWVAVAHFSHGMCEVPVPKLGFFPMVRI